MASIQGVYVALFGRPADPTGLTYFNGVTQNGADLSAIGDLASTNEYKTRFSGMDNTQIVTAIYQSLFDRGPETAGLDFFVDALNKGTLSINNIAIAILDGAQGSDKTIIDTKIAAANLFTTALDTPTEVAAYMGNAAATAGINFLKQVTTTTPSQSFVDETVKALEIASNIGNDPTFPVTPGLNQNIGVGTGASDTTDRNDTITAMILDGLNNNSDAGDSWVVGLDKIDAGLGYDIFKLYIDTTGLVVGVDEFKSVEELQITSAAFAGGIDVANAKDTTKIVNAVSTTDLGVTGIALGTTVGVSGKITGVAQTTFSFNKDSGTSDFVKLTLDAATTSGKINITGIEAAEVFNTGTSDVVLNIADAKTLTLTGSGSLTSNPAANGATEAIDASGFLGKVLLNLTAMDALKTVTGSGQNDMFTVDAASALNDIYVSGGGGADHLLVASGAGTSAHTITLTGGAGADKFTITATATVDSNGSTSALERSMITIADFNKAEDVVDVSALVSRDTLDTFESATVKGSSDLKAAVDAAAGFIGAGRSAVFLFGGDAYVFGDTDGSHTLTAGDALIKIAGVSDLADLTAVNFFL